MIVAVLVFVGLFYYFAQADDGSAAVQMYRAETADQRELSASAAETTAAVGSSGTADPGETATTAAAISETEISSESAETGAAVPAEAAAAAAEAAATPETAAGDARINLNTASLEELDSLPGIGPATAKLILEYRQQYGGFAAPEEIKNVKRIGDKTYEKLKDRIRV